MIDQLQAAAGTAVLAICLPLSYVVLLLDADTVRSIVVFEDGVYQNVGAAALLSAAVLFGVAFARRRRIAYAVLAVAFFVGAGEEAGWGQHLLGFDPPAGVERANAQGELTLHNLNVLQRGGEANPVDRLFFAAGLGFTLLIPALVALAPSATARVTRALPIVPLPFGLLFLANFLVSKGAEQIFGSHLDHAIVEIKETFFALLFAAIGLAFARRERGYNAIDIRGRPGFDVVGSPAELQAEVPGGLVKHREPMQVRKTTSHSLPKAI